MRKIDPEFESRFILRSTGRDDDEPPIVLELAADIVGGDPVIVVPATEVWGFGEAEEVEPGRWKIFVCEGQPDPELAFTICHELAEIHVLKLGVRLPWREKEDLCNAIAAALVAPRRAFLDALADHGEDFGELALDFLASETCMALRLGEVRKVPVCVVSEDGRRRVRGPAWSWPDDVRADRPGLRRARLRDRGERLALIAG